MTSRGNTFFSKLKGVPFKYSKFLPQWRFKITTKYYLRIEECFGKNFLLSSKFLLHNSKFSGRFKKEWNYTNRKVFKELSSKVVTDGDSFQSFLQCSFLLFLIFQKQHREQCSFHCLSPGDNIFMVVFQVKGLVHEFLDVNFVADYFQNVL